MRHPDPVSSLPAHRLRCEADAFSGDLRPPLEPVGCVTWTMTVARFLRSGYPTLLSCAGLCAAASLDSLPREFRSRIQNVAILVADLPPDQIPRRSGQQRRLLLGIFHGVPRTQKSIFDLPGRAELEAIVLAPWATRRRQDLLDLLDQLTPKIQELTRALEEEVEKRAVTRRLMTHPGVGPLTALAYELVIGTPERFHCGKQIASYVGLVPAEKSSGDRRRLGHISKQGNALLRFLLVEAAQVTVRSQPQWRSKFFHLALPRGRKIAKVAMARKLAVHLYWMWRQGWDYDQFKKLGSHAGEPGNRDGGK
jgi:Transposase IS116/IS110/IS902 family